MNIGFTTHIGFTHLSHLYNPATPVAPYGALAHSDVGEGQEEEDEEVKEPRDHEPIQDQPPGTMFRRKKSWFSEWRMLG